MFDTIDLIPDDPILGLTKSFREDPRETKIDLGVGVYKLADGSTPIMRAVKEAQNLVTTQEATKSYTPPAGYSGFGEAITKLVFGDGHPAVEEGRVAVVQTPGGCGALRLGADVISRVKSAGLQRRLYIGTPTWANHVPLLGTAGLKVEMIPYYDRATSSLSFDAFAEHLRKLGPEDVVLLHGACHNPSGADFSPSQWEEITQIALERGFLPFIDTAYHGFAVGLEQDVASIRLMASKLPEVLISYSCSKNFGLYRERAGALIVVGKNNERAKAVQSHMMNVARTMYSMPPAHGGAIVTAILQSAELTQKWQTELADMNADVNDKRNMLAATARDHGLDNVLNFIADQNGMFSLLPLGKEQVGVLRDDFGIYMTFGGRINICGLTQSNIDNFCKAYKSVL